MSPRQSHARIQGQITGKAREVGPIEAHERNVLAVSKRIVNLALKVRTLQRQLKEARAEMKAKRRELRAILQRDPNATEDTPALGLGGKADAVDASLALVEARPVAPASPKEPPGAEDFAMIDSLGREPVK